MPKATLSATVTQTTAVKMKLTAKQIVMGQALYATRQHTVREICDQLDCSPARFYRAVRPVTDAAH